MSERMDYEIQFIMRDTTEEEVIKKAGEMHDLLFMSYPDLKHELFVMEIFQAEEDSLPGMRNIYFWPKDAKGPFNDLGMEEGEEK